MSTFPAICLIAPEVLVARFATDPKISTQLGRREAPCLGKCCKAFFFGHYINFIPWHKSHFNVTDVLVLSVTYVFVSYPGAAFIIFLSAKYSGTAAGLYDPEA